VTYYTVFVIDLASRRVQILGSTPHPNDLFMQQVGRTLTAAEVGSLRGHCVLICDRDRKWSREVRRLLDQAGSTSCRHRSKRRMPMRTRNAVRHDGAERRPRCNRSYFTAALLHKR
jgi:hypothetical protein